VLRVHARLLLACMMDLSLPLDLPVPRHIGPTVREVDFPLPSAVRDELPVPLLEAWTYPDPTARPLAHFPHEAFLDALGTTAHRLRPPLPLHTPRREEAH
jgi:hypothetical protein